MERLVQVDREQLKAQMRAMVDQTLAQVMDAVNAAKDGRLIEDSEMPVFHLMKELERNVFEKALQLRVDSTESTFSPSQGCGGQDQAQQGTRTVLAVDTTGPGRLVADEVLRSGRRKQRANRQADR
jgi:hypothetical protein